MGDKNPRYRRKKKKPINEKRIPTQKIPKTKKIDPRCSKPHRLIVTDKETKIEFLLAADAQVSLFPKFLIEESSNDVNRIEHSDILVDSSGTIIYTSGQITLQIDLGLGKLFCWKFTLVDFERPIIGRDFLSHFHLQINFQRMCLINLKTGLETPKILTVACECHRNDNSDDGWPNITAIFKRSLQHRNHITDKNTKKAFLIGFSSQISVFPKSEVREEDLEPFNGSFELHWLSREVAHVLGWNVQKLDFGLGREFTWKFAVIDIDKPIIGFDFINYFGLTQQLKMGYLSLFDSETNMATPAPSGPCDCGNFREGWPKSCFLIPVYPKQDPEPLTVFNELLTDVKSSKENPEPPRKSHNQNLEEYNLNSEPFNGTLKPFSQNSRVLQLPKGKSEALIPSPELAKANLQPVNEKYTKFDEYPKPFTRNPKTFHQLFREIELLNQNPESSNQNSKESIQPFSQSLKPFNQSLRGLQLAEEIPTPFKQNPKFSNKNPKVSSQNSVQSKQSCESSDQNSREARKDRLETFREKPEEEIPKPNEKTPRESNGNFLKLDKKSNLKTDCRNAREEFGSVNKKSASPKNENPKEKPKDNHQTSKRNSSKLDNKFNLKEDSRYAREEPGSVSEKFTSPKNENPQDKLKDQPRASKRNSSKLDKKSNLKEDSKNAREERGSPSEKFRSPINENLQGKPQEQHNVSSTNSSKLDKKSNLKEDSINAREESESVSKKSASPKNENPQAELRDQPQASNINSSKLNNKPNVKHRFHVTDRETNLHFLIGTESELSVFPQERVRKERREPFDGSFEVSGGFGKTEKIFGWTTQIIDIGLGREFTWQFALINIGKPILGWDFISHFGLSFHTGGLLDLETKITAPPPDSPCDCESINDGWPTFVNFMKVPTKEKPICIEEESSLDSEASERKDDSQLTITDKISTTSKRRKSKKHTKSSEENTKTKAEGKEYAGTKIESFTSKEEKFKKETKSEEKIFEISNKLSKMDHKSQIKHCFHIIDEETKLSFLLDRESEISVFPKSKMGEKPLETQSDAYEIIDYDGTVMPVLGWTTRELDFGIGEKFSWQFAVIDIGKPILTHDFLAKFNLGINEKKEIIYNKYGRWTKLPSEPWYYPEVSSIASTSLKIRRVPHKINHHFHLMDKNSNMVFFVSQMSQVSLVPRCQIPIHLMEVSKNSEITDCGRIVLPIYGWVTLKIDFGLKREFEWKFAVVETLRPIIALDFLKHFHLKTHYGMESPRLFDPETNMETSKFIGSCNCGDSYDFPVLTFLKKLDSASEELTIQKKLENNITRCSDDRCPKEERIILVERVTGMPYLLSGATISVFPESETSKEDIEPFDDSFDLVQMNGSVVPVHGWIFRKLDFGLGRYFFWKFAVINIGRPLLANDFLHHYDFTVSYKGRSVFDALSSKTVVGSTDFCECQARNFWPGISSMGIKFKRINKTSPERIRQGTMEDSTSSEEDDFLKK